ncbi:DUF6478 family protein [Oceaniglobus roseus]|uniref:DUF6478 family protein n=1 Tax=Oceaniglobus roseus TaxID=1737570 RepID=UPI001561DCF2|nr:DUF6478 family protein [Kandeliimicrobium roseum]
MADTLKRGLGRWLDRRMLRRWTRLARKAPAMELGALRALRGRAEQLRDRTDRVIRAAEMRLVLPRIGSNAIQKPLGTDWAFRPELWMAPLPRPGAVAVESRTQIGGAVTIFHDCRISELTFRQLRNSRAGDLAPFGLRMDVFRFDGSFLSLVIDLPEAAARNLTRRHILQMDTLVEIEKPIEIFARLNIRHGPNTEQIVRELPVTDHTLTVEFDLNYTDLNEKRIEKLWIDLIFEDPEMNQIILRDLTLTRRPRAEL